MSNIFNGIFIIATSFFQHRQNQFVFDISSIFYPSVYFYITNDLNNLSPRPGYIIFIDVPVNLVDSIDMLDLFLLFGAPYLPEGGAIGDSYADNKLSSDSFTYWSKGS